MKPFRSSLFWIAALVLTFAAAVYSYTHYTRAFPILNQKITMDRSGATRAALDLAGKFKWSPTRNADAVARLTQNSDLMDYIELEAGGKANLGTLVASGEIKPTRWDVRLYREKDAAETLVEFSPQGQFLGFSEKLPDAQAGRNLTADQARALAVGGASAMGLGLDGFKLASSTDNRVSSGRIDHTFTYERPNPHLGAGREQCVLVVRGDRFSGYSRGVKIPDEFFSRFSAMRASNKDISIASEIAMGLILVLGGVVGGLIFLAGKSKIGWRGPVVLASILAATAALNGYSFLPLSWFGYYTALSSSAFEIRLIIGLVIGALVMLVYAPVYAAAEGLAREAFPEHPQLWKVFSPRAAGTRPVFGAVLGGTLLCVVMFAYEVAVQTLGTKHLGWWMPSQLLFDPTLLSSRIPWTLPFHIALLAGTTEECLFRALPLAGAVLLGRKFGRKDLWVVGALVLEALIFGSAHSGYPTMPGWARMAELFIPAVVFGLLFLRFGLLPGMIMHFSYDALCMGLPLYTARIHGSTGNSVVVLVLVLAPLAWVSFCRIRAGAWRDLPDDLKNAAWSRTTRRRPAAQARPLPSGKMLTPRALKLLFLAGVAAMAVWTVSMSLAKPDFPDLTLRKSAAIASARAALVSEGVHLGADWKPLPVVQYDPENESIFVWQTAGKTVFHRLLGNYLAVPGWHVRFVRDTIPLPDRTEEYRVFLAGDGKVQRYEHIVPESRPAPSLARAAALRLAETQLKRVYGLDASSLKLVTADETKQPKRSDWTFVWKDPRVTLGAGEARVWINLAGDTLSGFGRNVYVPEAWTRERTAKANTRTLTLSLLGMAVAAGVIACLIGMLVRWKRRPFAVRVAVYTGITWAVYSGLEAFVKLPVQVAWMSTSEPIHVQTVRILASLLVSIPVLGGLMAVFVGVGSNRTETATPARARPEFLGGLGAGFLLVLGERFVDVVRPHWSPWHAGMDGANSGLPYLGSLWVVGILIMNALFALGVQRSVDAVVRPGILRTAIFVAFGLAFGATVNSSTWTGMVLCGTVFAIAFPLMDRLVVRSHPSVIIAIFTARMVGNALAGIVIPGQPGSLGDGLVGIALAILVGWLLFTWMRPKAAPPPPLLPAAPNRSDIATIAS